MYQVLFRIPIPWSSGGIPIYGYGAMLFLGFLTCTWLAGRRAEREGIPRQIIQDLALWLFVGGLLGARITYLLKYGPPSLADFLWELPRIWDGGIILYGAVIGGAAAYALAYLFVLRKRRIPTLKMADIIAPSVAVGICLGRIGCFLNGCCYGSVTCHEPKVHFPFSSPARVSLVEQGFQTAAGFTMTDQERPARVAEVEADSPAARSGLRAGDEIVEADGLRVDSYSALRRYLVREWPRGKSDLSLTVVHPGQTAPQALPPFRPHTLGLHPTQLYESVSMGLLFLLLTAFYPFRRHEGEVMVLLMLCYAVHRYLNELLRGDARPVAFEQNVSVLLFVAGLGLGVWLWLFWPPLPRQAPAAS